MRTVAIIPARGGSKGIPRKNVKEIAGKPLIRWTIEAALGSRRLDRVVVSTEDSEIASIAKAAGASVPFRRPPELAADDTSGIAPVLHALEALPEADAVLLLQPTSPLRTAADIDALLALAERSGAASIVSVTEARDHPHWTYRIENEALRPFLSRKAAARRQDLPPAYALNGALYFATAAWLLEHRTLVGQDTLPFIMPPERSIDIDGALEWRLAEMLLRERSSGTSTRQP